MHRWILNRWIVYRKLAQPDIVLKVHKVLISKIIHSPSEDFWI